MKILSPWLMYAEYEDGYAGYFGGDNESICMCDIIEAEQRHGSCTYYTGVENDYYTEGQLTIL